MGVARWVGGWKEVCRESGVAGNRVQVDLLSWCMYDGGYDGVLGRIHI